MSEPDHRNRPGNLLDRLDSFEQLHLLVLVAADPGRAWFIDQLRLGDGHDPDDVRPVARELVDAGVLVDGPGGTVSLAPEPRIAADVAALLRSYEEDPLPVIRALTRRSMERLRSATARTFADAFVVRRRDS